MRTDDRFAAVIEAAAAEEDFSGIVRVEGADGTVFERCFGFAHRGLGVANASRTRFALASGSKTFTAVAVLRLVESGLIELGTPVRPILGGDLPLIDDSVTVEHLLAHTSGIGDYLDEAEDWEATDYVLDVGVHTLAETAGFLPLLAGHPQEFAPGERFAYCNAGYLVLALVVERVSGIDFHTYCSTEVFARAGLGGTAFLRSDELPGDAALGYLGPSGNRTNLLHLPVRGNGDGGAYATASDLHRFWRALLSGELLGSGPLAAMTRARSDIPDEPFHYGLGVYVDPDTGVLAMEGYDAGVSMRSLHDPATATTASVLGNTTDGAWPIAEVLLNAITGQPLTEVD